MRRSGIYKIEHTASGRVYVGSAVRIENRWNEHKAKLRRSAHENRRLQNAWNKYGADAFVFSVLEVVDDRNNLVQREQHWIDTLNAATRPNFNLRPNARTMLGFAHSDETKEKLSQIQSSRKRGPLSLDHRAILSERAKGRKMHPNTRAAIHASMTNRQFGPEFSAKLSAALKGLKRSPETRAKISFAAKHRSQEHRDKLAQVALKNNTIANLNTPSATAKRLASLRSPEQRARVSAQFKGVPKSPEHLANIAKTRTNKTQITPR